MTVVSSSQQSSSRFCKRCMVDFPNDSLLELHIFEVHLRGLMINTKDGPNYIFSRTKDRNIMKCHFCREVCSSLNQVLAHLFCDISSFSSNSKGNVQNIDCAAINDENEASEYSFLLTTEDTVSEPLNKPFYSNLDSESKVLDANKDIIETEMDRYRNFSQVNNCSSRKKLRKCKI